VVASGSLLVTVRLLACEVSKRFPDGAQNEAPCSAGSTCLALASSSSANASAASGDWRGAWHVEMGKFVTHRSSHHGDSSQEHGSVAVSRTVFLSLQNEASSNRPNRQ